MKKLIRGTKYIDTVEKILYEYICTDHNNNDYNFLNLTDEQLETVSSVYFNKYFVELDKFGKILYE